MSQFHLLKTKKFYPLFWTQFCGAFNDNFLKNAMVILFTFKATTVMGIPSAEMVPLAGGIFILPFFLFSATAGQLADKYEKSKIIRIIKLIEIGIMLLAGFGFIFERSEFLLFVLFLMGMHSTFFGPLKYSILPQHLSNEDLVAGNALVEAGTFLSILIGTITGNVLINLPRGTGWVSSGLFLIAVLGWLTSEKIPIAPAVDPTLQVQWNPIPPTLDIYRFTKKNRPVFLSILGISWFWFFGAAMLSLFPTYCKDVLMSGPNVVTLLLATFSIGVGFGSVFCAKLSHEQLELGLVPLGSIGISLFTADLFRVGTPDFAIGVGPGTTSLSTMFHQIQGIHILVDLLFLSIFSGLYIVPLYTLIQERSAITHRSRVIAANNILNAFFMVGSAVLTVVMMRIGLTIPQMFLVLAVLNAIAAAYIYTLLPEFLLRFMIWILANILYRVKVIHGSRIPKKGAAILVCNHVSYVDWMIILASVKRPVRFVMDHNLLKGQFARAVFGQAKVIPIAPEKEDPEVLKQAFIKIAEELRAGEMICIFPEGNLTRDGQMRPFKTGVEKIVEQTPVDVYPMALRGFWGSFFSREGGKAVLKRPKRFWSRVELSIGERVPAAQVKSDLLFEKVSTLLK